MPRLFVGLEFDENLKSQLAALRDEVGSIKMARWTPKRNLHLTLKFLGHVPDELVGSVSETIRHAVEGKSPFVIRLGKPGAFPSPRRARILWYGLSEGVEAVASLAGPIESALETKGFPPEHRPFHPHITLARIGVAQDIRQNLERLGGKIEGQSVAVSSVTLFESRLAKTGAEYFALERYKL